MGQIYRVSTKYNAKYSASYILYVPTAGYFGQAGLSFLGICFVGWQGLHELNTHEGTADPSRNIRQLTDLPRKEAVTTWYFGLAVRIRHPIAFLNVVR